jgi:serine/threonine-protein kinase
MAPEQFKGEVDRRSDLFTLGVVLYELLAGDKLFQGRNEIEIMSQIMFDEPPALHLPPSLSAAIEPIVGRALARNPDERQQNADQLRFELEIAAGKLGLESSRRDVADLVASVASVMVTAGVAKADGTPEWTMGAFEAARTEPFRYEDDEETRVAHRLPEDAKTIERPNPPLRPRDRGVEDD